MLDLGADVLAFRRGPLTVVLNCGADAGRAARAASVLLASGPLRRPASCRPTRAVWLR